MAEALHHPDGRLEHPSVRHEPSDASFGAIAMTLVGAFVFLAGVHFTIMGFFTSYRDRLMESNRSPSPLAPVPSIALPHQPRLEQIDRLEGITHAEGGLRASRLTTYGPTDAEGYVHIPIKRAMQFMVDKNVLRARPQPPAEDSRRAGGLVDAGESNSGRMFKEKRP